jgi:hypothetical protein
VGGGGRLALAVATTCALLLAVTGCVSQDLADSVNRRLEYGISTSELRIANAVAYHVAQREAARITTARATVSGPESTPSPGPAPTPRTCRLLHLTLSGYFPHAPSSAGSPLVSGQQLTVDAGTGRVCEKHYLTGVITNDPMSVRLFSG